MSASRAAHRFIAMAEWQACALLSGEMTQMRVPVGLWRVQPKPGTLIWVQEPFVHLEGTRRDKFYEAVLYRADVGPAGGLPPAPADARNRQYKTHVCTADKMWRGASRLTLEVTRVGKRECFYFEVGDRQREGFQLLKAAFPALHMDEAFRDHWRRTDRKSVV